MGQAADGKSANRELSWGVSWLWCTTVLATMALACGTGRKAQWDAPTGAGMAIAKPAGTHAGGRAGG